MHNIKNLWKFEDWSSDLRDNYERKNTLVTRSCVLSDTWFRDLKFYTWGLKIKFVENYFFLENYVTSMGAVLTMFYTINLFPLLITKWGFMLTIILSNYLNVISALEILHYLLYVVIFCL